MSTTKSPDLYGPKVVQLVMSKPGNIRNINRAQIINDQAIMTIFDPFLNQYYVTWNEKIGN